MKQILLVLLLCGCSLVTSAHGKKCSSQEAEAADALVDELVSWKKIDRMVKEFKHCDDGSIAEGNSEAVARLLVDKWATLHELPVLIKSNPALQTFVLRHIDSTLDTEDLEKMRKLSSTSCPANMLQLCKDIGSSAGQALKTAMPSSAR